MSEGVRAGAPILERGLLLALVVLGLRALSPGGRVPLAAQSPVTIEVTETVLVRDGISVRPPASISFTESVPVTDGPRALPQVEMGVVEPVPVQDAVAVRPPAGIGVDETVSVQGEVTVRPPAEIGVGETVAVTETVVVLPPAEITATETVAVSDEVAVRPPAEISVTESVSVSDDVGVSPPTSVAVSETVDVTDAVTVSTSTPTPPLVAYLDTEDVSGLRGGSVTVPVVLEVGDVERPPASFTAALGWDFRYFDFLSVEPGGFSDQVTVDAAGVYEGMVEVSGERSGGASGTTTLLNLRLRPLTSAEPGSRLGFQHQFQELLAGDGTDLLSRATWESASLCVAGHPLGDVDSDGSVGSGDAVQILRHTVGLPLADGADVSRGDLDGDGAVDAGDAVATLRHAVELPLPSSSPVGRYRVGGCPASSP